MIKTLTKFQFFLLICCSLFGCNLKHDAIKLIDIQSNFDSPREYVINVKIEQQKLQDMFDIVFFNEKEPVENILLGQQKVNLKVAFNQRWTPFSFFKGHLINGNIIFKPSNSAFESIYFPFDVYIKPWIMTNWWTLVTFLILMTLFFITNLIAHFVLIPASGRASIIYPNNLMDSRIIYPPSLINHFTRNRYRIGTGRFDQWILDDDKFEKFNISKGHISLRFFKRRKEKCVEIKSNKHFYFKLGKPQRKAKPKLSEAMTSSVEKHRYQVSEELLEYKVNIFVTDRTQTNREEHFKKCRYKKEKMIQLPYKSKGVVLVFGAGDYVLQIETPSE